MPRRQVTANARKIDAARRTASDGQMSPSAVKAGPVQVPTYGLKPVPVKDQSFSAACVAVKYSKRAQFGWISWMERGDGNEPPKQPNGGAKGIGSGTP